MANSSSGMGSWIARLFPWIFVLVGIALLGFGLRDAFRGWQSARWPVTSGKIVSSSVEEHSDSDGHSYAAKILYQFRVEPQGYTGDKVVFGAVSGGHAGAYALAGRYPEGKQVEVHYHPENPELCVLEPGLRAAAFALPGVGLVFAGFGLIFVWAFSFSRKKLPPGTNPWEHKRWRGGVARHQLGMATGFAFFMGTLFAGVSGGILAANSREALMREKPLIAFIAGFLLVGSGILIYAVISLFRWLRFHGCFVRMQTVPGVIGGKFAGFLNLPSSFPEDADVRLELICEATTTTPGRGNRDSHTSTSVEWSRKLCIHPSARQHGLQGGAPFEFTIPYGLHDETDECQNGNSGSSTSYGWTLQATATLPGADLNLKFPVPVFRTKDSDSSLTSVPESGQELPLEQYLDEQGEKQRIRIENQHQGPVYVGGIRPVIWTTLLVPGIVCLIFGGAGMGLLLAGPQRMMFKELHAPNGIGDALFMLMPLVFIIVPTVIGLVCSASGVLFACMTSKEFISRRTWIASGMVQHRRRFLGIPLRAIRIPCAEVGWVGVNGSMSSGGKSWKDVTIETYEARQDQDQPRSGKNWKRLLKAILKPGSITVATSIPTRRETDKIIKDLRNAINQQRHAPITDETEDSRENENPDPDAENQTPN